jgi:hypothetical protein
VVLNKDWYFLSLPVQALQIMGLIKSPVGIVLRGKRLLKYIFVLMNNSSSFCLRNPAPSMHSEYSRACRNLVQKEQIDQNQRPERTGLL